MRNGPPEGGHYRDGPPEGGHYRDGPPEGGHYRDGPPEGGHYAGWRALRGTAGTTWDRPPNSGDDVRRIVFSV